jgi:hypothetical protein
MSLVKRIQQLLQQEAIKFYPDGPTTFLLAFHNPEGLYYGDLQVNEEHRAILIQMAPPLEVPPEKRRQMTELVTRANQYITLGNLQMNVDSGLITCRTSVVLGNSNCQSDLFYNLLASNWCEIERWFPAMKAVITAGLSPEQAVNMVRHRQKSTGGDIAGGDDASGGHLSDIQRGSLN